MMMMLKAYGVGCPLENYYDKTSVIIPSPSFVPKPSPEPLTDAVPLCLRSRTYGKTFEVRSTIVSTTDVVIACVSMTIIFLNNNHILIAVVNQRSRTMTIHN